MATRVLKSIAAGIIAAIALGVLAIVAEVAVAWFRVWLQTRNELVVVGGFSVIIPGIGFAVAAPMGLAIGFYWQFKRGRGQRQT